MKRSNKLLFAIIFSVLIFIQSLNLGLLAGPGTVNAAGETKIQVYIITTNNPGYIWCQKLDGTWTTDSTLDGPQSAENYISGGMQQPETTRVKTHANINKPVTTASQWRITGTDEFLPANAVIDPNSIVSVQGIKNGVAFPKMGVEADSDIQGKPYIDENDQVIIEGNSGYGIEGYYNPTGCGGRPMWNYPFPVEIMWVATATISDQFLGLRIDPEEHTLNVGGKQHFTVYAEWLQNGVKKEYEVADNKLAWSSDAPAKVSVDSGGTATGLQVTPGTSYATITATFTEQHRSVSARVRVIEAGQPTPTPTPTPPPSSITGDFDILPSSSIDWRDPFELKPKNIVTNNATYQYHYFRIERDGRYDYSSLLRGKTLSANYTYATYPGLLHTYGTGTYTVSMKIVTDKGDSGWIAPKTLTLTSPADNRPPVFKAGFFKENDYASFIPLTEIVVGSRVNLRIIQDPRTDPPEPYDPDGDSFTYRWDFAGSSSEWIRSLPEKYGLYDRDERHTWLTADVLGYHQVQVTATDTFGASSTRTVSINVIPPNPIPKIEGPDETIEGRPIPEPWDGSQSYSPMGRTISAYIWTNNKDVYDTPGTERITLDVVDSAGLRSVSPAVHTLTVKPDLPPVADLQYMDMGIRNTPMTFKDNSYSPDGDNIVEHKITLICDKNNDGVFNEAAANITLDDQGEFKITPTTVGKCRTTVFVKEDWGKSATGTFDFTVVNLAPTADFSAYGEIPEPPNITTISPSMSTLMSSPDWTASSLRSSSVSKGLFVLNSSDNSIETIGLSAPYPYSGITMNNVTTREDVIERRYCGTCGNTGSAYGYFFDFSDQYRIDRRIWGGNYYNYFYNEDIPSPAYGNPVLHALTNMYRNSPIVNRDSGRMVTRIDPYNQYANSHTWNYLVYRISDIRNYVPGQERPGYPDSIVNVNPSDSWSWRGYPSTPFGYGYPSDVRNVPIAPDTFTLPPSYINGVDMTVTNTPANGGVRPDISPSTTVKSNYNKDKQGNEYRNACVIHSTWGYKDGCKLEKYSPSGAKLWEKNTGSISENVIESISSDDSKIVVKTYANANTSYVVLNASTGAEIARFRSPAFTRGSANYYLGVYDDVVAYIRQTVDAGFMTQEGAWGHWELRFYNLKTGQTTSAGTIKSFVGATKYYGLSHYYYIAAMPSAVISADGKLIVANYYTNVLIYDMKTFALEGNIPLSPNDPESAEADYEDYGSDNDWNTLYSIKGMHLTEDGRVKIVYHRYHRDTSRGNMSDEPDDDEENIQTAVTIQTTPSSGPKFSYGYLTNDNYEIRDGSIAAKVRFNRNTYSDSASVGIGFRSQDHQNMYRAEVSTSRVSLTKIVNGASTTLGSYSFAAREGAYNDLKVEARGSRLAVYLNGVPVIEKTDDTFKEGLFGLYAEAPYAVLKDLKASLFEKSVSEIENQAIVNEPITYSKTYSDPEQDPAIADETAWTFTNLEPRKFLDAGDGASDPVGTNTYNGIVVREPSPSLSKVGMYKVELAETDDPAPAGYKHPNSAFAEYRKPSYPAANYLIVHRLPVSEYTLSVSPEDRTVVWTDASHDPDRWLSPTKYSTENTGIDYRTTRGILERRYFYQSPSGQTAYSKLVAPTETGTYTVGMAVKDEYGAWSDWTIRTITIAELPQPDDPPNAGFTLDKTVARRGEPIRISSTAWDHEDGNRTNLIHTYYIRNQTVDGPESLQSMSRTEWLKTFNTVGTHVIRQVVEDSKGQTAHISKTVTIVNAPPVADFAWMPELVWEGDELTLAERASDPDGDELTYLWTVTGPNGLARTSSASAWTLGRVEPGHYRVTLDVSDGAASDSKTVTIAVRPLILEGDVSHTPLWLARHQELGHETLSHPKDFYSGEKLMVSATVSEAPVESVESSLEATGLDGEAVSLHALLDFSGPPGAYAGELYDPVLQSIERGLPNGEYVVRFRARYGNGVVKTADVPIRIIGNVHATYGVQRIK